MMLLAPLIQSHVADTAECAQKSSLIIDHLDHTFIRFQTPFEILDSTPVQVLRVLTSLLSLVALPNCPLSFSLPDDITIESAVPLAAILLDYPVAYVPTSTENNILSNVPLNFYECLLIVGGNIENQRHEITIMKFSCPAELTNGQGRNLDPDRTVKLLQNIFSARLEQIGETSLGIAVQLSTQTVGHVVI
ncbi:hypothetical protein CPB84DRAFT_1774870 [Gymnopilus junonius]|uniref:Uncharacterized protein n=1 Tax=Gymnopilus junonius TaxID=109634 RepID=A0A9P5TPF4_GYMJU|nr:hypothetical protein CPB84DRAFT_1774870 [Gymnopilus junonius]